MQIKQLLSNTAFFHSWKSLDKKFVHVLFFDYLYSIFFLIIGSFFWYRVLPLFGSVLDSAKGLQSAQAFSSTQAFLSTVQGIGTQWSMFKWYSLGVFALIFVDYVLFKYLVWRTLQKKQESLSQFFTHLGFFAVVNLLVVLFYVLILVASWYLFVLETFNIMFFFVVPLLFLFTMNIMHPIFVQKPQLSLCFSCFWNIGIKNIHKWIIPHLLLLSGAYLIMLFVALFTFLPDALYFFWYVLCFAAYFCWAKYYIFAVLQKIQTRQKK